jgi:transcriptional regulator PpsR
VNVDVLLANLRQRGSVRLFATVMRGEQGASTEVEISAAAIGGGTSFGLQIRDVGRRPSVDGPELPQQTAEQLTGLIGRVPLRELVRRSSDVIERLCIDAALKLTRDNRAAAAELLGLSRQSFYVKLRRYGLGDLGPDDDVTQ